MKGKRASISQVIILFIMISIASVSRPPDHARAATEDNPFSMTTATIKNFIHKIKEYTAKSGQEIGKRIEALEKLLELTQGNDAWTESLWRQAVRISQQAGITIDELIPSVSGCVHDDMGKPVYGAFVTVLPETIDIGLPTYALTGAGAMESANGIPSTFGFGLSGPVIPVSASFVPKSYLETFNRGGCYWVPVAPGVLHTLGNLFALPEIGSGTENAPNAPGSLAQYNLKIIPFHPGYIMRPVGKTVYLKRDGTFYHLDMETLGGAGKLATMEEKPLQ